MNNILLSIFLLVSTFSLSAPSSLSDSTQTRKFKFEDFVQNGIRDSIPFYVFIDSNEYILADINYDAYYNVIQGRVLRNKKEGHHYPYNLLILEDYSTLPNGLDQIRLLDIQEARHYAKPQADYKRKKYCSDQLIMTSGDTIVCRIFKISDTRIEYQKCSQKIKRVYGKDKDKILKINFHNGNVLEFDSKAEAKINRDKRNRIIKGVSISLLMVFAAAASILLLSY